MNSQFLNNDLHFTTILPNKISDMWSILSWQISENKMKNLHNLDRNREKLKLDLESQNMKEH